MCNSVNKVNDDETLEMAQEFIDSGKESNDFTKVMLGRQMKMFVAMKRDHSDDRHALLTRIEELSQTVQRLNDTVKGMEKDIRTERRTGRSGLTGLKARFAEQPALYTCLSISLFGNLWSIGGLDLIKAIIQFYGGK